MSRVASRFAELVKDIPASFLGGDIAESSGKGKGKAEDVGEVAKWLSDWHLLAFLDGVGIFDVVSSSVLAPPLDERLMRSTQADIKLMAHVATTRDVDSLAKLFKTSSWQTFLTIAREEGTLSSPPSPSSSLTNSNHTAPSVPPRTYPGGTDTKFDDGFEIPPDVDVPPDTSFGDVDMAGPGDGDGAGGGGGEEGGVVVCPHCTFENAVGSMDCDICGLPLAG